MPQVWHQNTAGAIRQSSYRYLTAPAGSCFAGKVYTIRKRPVAFFNPEKTKVQAHHATAVITPGTRCSETNEKMVLVPGGFQHTKLSTTAIPFLLVTGYNNFLARALTRWSNAGEMTGES